MPTKPKPILLLCGPTASGKTARAIEWAKTRKAHVLNADSMQHYHHLATLTARPEADLVAQCPHHLFGHLDPKAIWSSGEWLRHALLYIDAARNDGPPLCIVGGTGLYFNALIKGLASIPPVPKSIRDALETDFDAQGEVEFRSRLKAIDPRAEARIMAHDRQRLVRALAVYHTTNQSLSDWQAQTRPVLCEDEFELEILRPDRDGLYARIDQRFEAMIKGGAIDDMHALMALGLKGDWPIMRVLGASEIHAYLLGALSLAEAIAKAQQATRNYAKRQMTWCRNQFNLT